jgi:hypothetical protein
MDLQMNGKTALVTGASAGIGKAIAFALAREGVPERSPIDARDWVGIAGRGTTQCETHLESIVKLGRIQPEEGYTYRNR